MKIFEVQDGLDIKKELNDQKKIKKFKKKFNSLNIDGYIIPKNDEFFRICF